jgi:hypothetical protein
MTLSNGHDDHRSRRFRLPTHGLLAAEIEERCSVMGTTKCDIRDLVFLGLAMDAGDPSVETRCDAALSPVP